MTESVVKVLCSIIVAQLNTTALVGALIVFVGDLIVHCGWLNSVASLFLHA